MLRNLGAVQSDSSCCVLSVMNNSHFCINFLEENSDYNLLGIT